FADGTFFGNFAPSRSAPKGPLFGGQAGYNWQVSNVVLGLEGDAQFSDMENVVCNFGCDNAAPIDQRLRWFATARGRIGWAMPSGKTSSSGAAPLGGIHETDNIPPSFTGVPTGGSFTHTRTGWVAGGGLEVHLGGNWTGNLEFLRLDLAPITEVLPLP